MKKLGKKVLLTGAVLAVSGLVMTGCNKQIIDTTFNYDYAYISMPNGEVVEGEIESWKDFEDGDQIQVKIDGDMYLVHSSNIIMIDKD